MAQREEVNVDFRRAMFLLNKRINNAADLVKLWAYAGPCAEKCPSLEKINKK